MGEHNSKSEYTSPAIPIRHQGIKVRNRNNNHCKQTLQDRPGFETIAMGVTRFEPQPVEQSI